MLNLITKRKWPNPKGVDVGHNTGGQKVVRENVNNFGWRQMH